MIWVYDKVQQKLVEKSEYNRLQAERAKPWQGEIIQRYERGHWRYNKATRQLEPIDTRRIDIEAPSVIDDEIPPTVSHATSEGLVFTSKRALRAHYKQHGMIETGGQRLKISPRKGADPVEVRDAVAKAINDIRYDNAFFTEKEKQVCKEEMRQYESWKRRNHL